MIFREKLIFGLFILLATGTSNEVLAQAHLASAGGAVEASPVNWMSFEEAIEKSKVEKRKIFIDVYTDWCGWCKVMDKNTFSEPKIAKILNEEFYAVKFDAEQLEDVVFNGTTFKFVPSGRKGYHQLAAALLNNQLSYPNFVFLSEDYKLIPVIAGYSSLPGYRKPEEFHVYLEYVINDHFMKMGVQDFQTKEYKSPYVGGLH